MAIKTFKCIICSAEVTKPQSYAYKDGRACRHHPEVQQNHEAQEQAKKDDLEQAKHRAENPGWRWKNHQESKDPYEELKAFGIKNPNEHCWCCQADGAYEHLFYERFLINLSKLELRSDEPISIFSFTDDSIGPNKEVQKFMKEEFGDKIPLRRIEVLPDYPDWKLNQVLSNNKNKQDKVQLVRMTGLIVLCKKCANEYQFAWPEAKDRKIDLDHLALVGHLVKPVVDTIAAKEIASEEINNIMNK